MPSGIPITSVQKYCIAELRKLIPMMAACAMSLKKVPKLSKPMNIYEPVP